MNKDILRDEHLEKLWHISDEKTNSLAALKEHMEKLFDQATIDELQADGLVDLAGDSDTITLTKKGADRARNLIRAHRIAEMLFYNVFGMEAEKVACEFEHTVSTELVDGICTLLGHPRQCPHGLPIPEGECCRRVDGSTNGCIVPLTNLKEGESARIAYVNCRNDQLIHKMDGLHIRPNTLIKLHQIRPGYVVECEGAHIALDKDIISNICVWNRCDSEGSGDGSKACPAGPQNWLRRLLHSRP